MTQNLPAVPLLVPMSELVERLRARAHTREDTRKCRKTLLVLADEIDRMDKMIILQTQRTGTPYLLSFTQQTAASAEESKNMIPSIGRIMRYTLTEGDAEAINRRREHAATHMREHRSSATGVMVHVGVNTQGGQAFPMIVVKCHGASHDVTSVNGQVLLDGSDSYWVRNVIEGTTAGCWAWPERA